MKQKKRELLYESLARISGEALYDGLLGEGLFADKLPPVFTSRPFCDWCKANSFASDPHFPTKGTPYVTTECMRNTNVPRVMGIPNPFTYDYLCSYLRDNWSDIKDYFKVHTPCQGYKVSQLHPRRMRNTAALFRMTYHSPDESFNPLVPDLMMGSRYEIHTDISTFFPSVYSHSIVWALKSKQWAKANKGKREEWPNQLDHRVQMIKYDETNGLLIGPHVSNLLSEIILARVDERLCANGKWKFIRCIDDCTCFARSKEDAERFVVEQAAELKEYGLTLNAKKTNIREMPIPSGEHWRRALTDYFSHLEDQMELGAVRACVDFLLELLKETGNTAVISYAMAFLAKRHLTEPARLYYVKIMLHLASVYPYLYRYLDERLFQPFGVENELLRPFFSQMLRHGLESKNYEEASYALYFSVRYGVRIEQYDSGLIIKTKDCVLLCMALIYTRDWRLDETTLHDFALELQKKGMFWEYWVFVYEALADREFSGQIEGRYREYIKAIKKDKISFLRTVDAISSSYSVQWEMEYVRWSLAYRPNEVDGNDMGPLSKLWDEFVVKYPSEGNAISFSYLNAIVTNLYLGRFTHRNVSFPYSDKTISRQGVIGPDGEPVSPKVLRRILSWLEKSGYVGSRVGVLAEGEGVYYWAKNPLGQLFAEMRTENVRRKSLGRQDDVVVLKDQDKNVVENPDLNAKAQRYLESLQVINGVYARHKFELDPGHGCQLQRFAPGLRAIFNNQSWDAGGRLYASLTTFGLDYQTVPSDMRRTITIDGNRSVELDYSAMHIRILYAQKGETLGRTDPYVCGSSKLRPLVKKALMILLNASSRDVVVYKLEEWRKELYSSNHLTQHEHQAKEAFQNCSDVNELLDAIERKHAKISDEFYTGVGVCLQNIDSQIALAVVMNFARRGIPVLPVHDSFIIAEERKDELREVMTNEFARICGGAKCEINEIADV